MYSIFLCTCTGGHFLFPKGNPRPFCFLKFAGPWHEKTKGSGDRIFEFFDWLMKKKRTAVRSTWKTWEKTLSKKIVFDVPNSCRCCNKTVLVKKHPVDILSHTQLFSTYIKRLWALYSVDFAEIWHAVLF